MKKIFLIIAGTALLFAARGQTITASLIGSGGFHSPEMEWAVGETLTQSYEQAPYLLTQGFFQSFVQTTAREQISKTDGFSLHPNPVKTETVLYAPRLTESAELCTAEVFSVTGRKISTIKLRQESNRLDFSDYPGGLYFVKISINQKPAQTIKCIKL